MESNFLKKGWKCQVVDTNDVSCNTIITDANPFISEIKNMLQPSLNGLSFSYAELDFKINHHWITSFQIDILLIIYSSVFMKKKFRSSCHFASVLTVCQNRLSID